MVKPLLLLCLPIHLLAQTRYLNEVFDSVRTTPDIVYAINTSVFNWNASGMVDPIPTPLKMDVYEPLNDTVSCRPLIVLLHSGRFLPPGINGLCSGTKNDREIEYLADHLAKMGFVVAAADYRIGFYPVVPSHLERIYQFVNAVYRGIQDSRTCARYFRKDASGNNHFKVDTNRFCLWGLGEGGTFAVTSNGLDTITDLYHPPFVSSDGPVVHESVNGNPDGTSVGISTGLYYPPGDTLNYPNHVGYSSDYQLYVNMGGVLIDTSLLDSGDAPIISAATQNVYNQWSEYCGIGAFGLVSPLNLPILGYVAGSCAIQELQAQHGNNLEWQNASYEDPISLIAHQRTGGLEALFPFVGITEREPWAFSDSIQINSASCDTDAAHAITYLDTMLAFFTSRAYLTLQLGDACTPLHSVERTAPSIKIWPNPAGSTFEVLSEIPILRIKVFDICGRMIEDRQVNVFFEKINMDCTVWKQGLYLLQIQTESGTGYSKLFVKHRP